MEFEPKMQRVADGVWARLSPAEKQELLAKGYQALARRAFFETGLIGHPIAWVLILSWALERTAVEVWGRNVLAGTEGGRR